MMRPLSILVYLVITSMMPTPGSAQDIPPSTQEQLENESKMDQYETEDDSYLLQLANLKRHPLNVNRATFDDLRELVILTDVQIENLLAYRNVLGALISIYELQAVPGWDLGTIKKVASYLTVSGVMGTIEEARTRLRDGDHRLLVRYSRALERSQGFQKSLTNSRYLGSIDRIFFRYRYQYKNLLQYGVVGDKDAGEQFFKGEQKLGFDFYSLHLFARKLGKIETLALGDFTVNIGQGLIQWQGLAFKKSSEVMTIKRQSSILRPYNSAGEFHFHRGIGVTVKFGPLQTTAFASVRKLSANVVRDTLGSSNVFSSFLTSGYHRTTSENVDRNKLRQISCGGNMVYKRNNWHIGINAVNYDFSLPIQKRNEPYNLFAIAGKGWWNMSVDYACTYRNLHVFGEAAMDRQFHTAFVNGLLISVDPRVDVAILQRSISRAYQAVYANAFTENSSPSNETGFYAGISVRPLPGWRVQLYVDLYSFPWIKYLVDAPSHGKEFLVQLTYVPNKQVDIFSRFRREVKQADYSGDAAVTDQLAFVPTQAWRTQLNYKISQSVTARNRVELLWNHSNKPDAQGGFLLFCDVVYAPPLKRFSAGVRLQYFETDDYDSRIYAYENDVLYSYSIPAFFGRGSRYYFNLNIDLNANMSCWIRWSQTIFPNMTSVGSGLDEIASNRRSEIKVQGQWLF